MAPPSGRVNTALSLQQEVESGGGFCMEVVMYCRVCARVLNEPQVWMMNVQCCLSPYVAMQTVQGVTPPPPTDPAKDEVSTDDDELTEGMKEWMNTWIFSAGGEEELPQSAGDDSRCLGDICVESSKRMCRYHRLADSNWQLLHKVLPGNQRIHGFRFDCLFKPIELNGTDLFPSIGHYTGVKLRAVFFLVYLQYTTD